MLRIAPELHGTGNELDLFLGKLFDFLLTHDTTQDIGLAERVARYDLGDLHDLFLIYDDTVSVLENRFQFRIRIFNRLETVLAAYEAVDVLHRTRPVESVQCDKVFYRLRLCVTQNLLHAP